MDVYEGYCVNKGMVLATVAKVRFDFGIPSLTPQRLRSLGERLAASEDGFVETEQVVLAAEKLPITLIGNAFPGIEVVGVIGGSYLNDDEVTALDSLLPTATTGMGGRATKGEDSFPVVGGLGDAFVRDIDEGEIVLVDANAGRVFVAPDAFLVAKLQTKSERKRYFLEGEHLPAKTASDNRVVRVYTRASNADEIEAGMAQGADGLYLATANTMLGEMAEPSTGADQVRILHEIMDLAGGKPLILDIPSTAIAYSALLEAAAGAPTSMVVDSLDTAADLTAGLEMTRNFSDPEATLGDVTLLLGIKAPGDQPLPENLDGIGGIVLVDEWAAYDLAYVIPILSLARHAGVPVYGSLGESWPDEIEDIVRFGAAGLIGVGANTADIKDAIRVL